MSNSHLARAYWIKLFTQHPIVSTIFFFILSSLSCHTYIMSFNVQLCFICKKKQFRRVRCKVAFHSKCSPWSDSVLQLKDNPGHTVCWRHPSDWRLDKKVNFLFSPESFTIIVYWLYCKLLYALPLESHPHSNSVICCAWDI